MRLQQVRTARGQGLRALARAAGLTPTGISNIESGKAMPSVATVEKLAKAFGCDPCWLAYGAGLAPDLTPAGPA